MNPPCPSLTPPLDPLPLAPCQTWVQTCLPDEYRAVGARHHLAEPLGTRGVGRWGGVTRFLGHPHPPRLGDGGLGRGKMELLRNINTEQAFETRRINAKISSVLFRKRHENKVRKGRNSVGLSGFGKHGTKP